METRIEFCKAMRADVPQIVALLANDPLGALREDLRDPLPKAYFAAFEAIDRDPNQELIVARREDGVIGVLQLSLIPSLTYRGGWRAQIEGVRVAAASRGLGLGRRLVQRAIQRARERGCRMVQLTTDKQRSEALRFYEGLGFRTSHEGLKLHFDPPPVADQNE